jgi:hypothetical protein
MPHTPGPWKYDNEEGCGFEVISYSGTICQIESCDEEADARLIAAAPEMLEALKAVRQGQLDDMPPEVQHGIDGLVDAAIKKAEEGM